MIGQLGCALAAAALFGLTACGVSPERDPQPLPTPAPSGTAGPALGDVTGPLATG